MRFFFVDAVILDPGSLANKRKRETDKLEVFPNDFNRNTVSVRLLDFGTRDIRTFLCNMWLGARQSGNTWL